MKERYDDIDEYIRDLQAEISQNDQCATHYYNLGVALLSKGDFVEAESAFLEAVRNSPHLAEAYIQLGGLCMQRGVIDGCKLYSHGGANCRGLCAVPWSNIGFVHLQRGEADEAVKALEKALRWDPEFLQARSTLASALFMKGDYDGCIAQCNAVLRKQPAFGPAWNNLSLAYFEKGEFDKAVECADKALEAGYDVPEAYLQDLAAHR